MTKSSAYATTCAPLPVTIPFLDRRFQPQLDQPQHCPVRDPASYRLHQLAVRNRIEVLGQVSVPHVGVAPADQPVHFLDRIYRPANGTVAIRTVLEVSLEDRFQHKLGSGLNHTIADGRYSERALAAIRFRYAPPPHRIGPIRLRDQFL